PSTLDPRRHPLGLVVSTPSRLIVGIPPTVGSLTGYEAFPIFSIRSRKCFANGHGLSSDRISAQDRLPDAGRFAKAGTADPRALGGNGSLSPAARDLARAGEICPA